MWLLIVATAILFASAMLVVIAIRIQADEWPVGLPPLPFTLWASTAVLIVSTVTMHRSLRMFRAGRSRSGSTLLVWTTGLAVVFLVLQIVSWFQWTAAVEASGAIIATHKLASSTFLLLTGVHAAHVIGGLVPLIWICGYALARGYTQTNHVAVRDVTMYWHFLDVIWLVLVVFMIVLL